MRAMANAALPRRLGVRTSEGPPRTIDQIVTETGGGIRRGLDAATSEPAGAATTLRVSGAVNSASATLQVVAVSVFSDVATPFATVLGAERDAYG
jgi:hypothetical protein